MKMPTWSIWLIVIVSLLVGGTIWWRLLPAHKQTFFKNFVRQVKYLPARYIA